MIVQSDGAGVRRTCGRRTRRAAGFPRPARRAAFAFLSSARRAGRPRGAGGTAIPPGAAASAAQPPVIVGSSVR
ncbi:hypothetical protein WS86_19225 [Burkholderia savannae]|nr:hypothetical protein WS86_19225 [Burkholderia savannae]KVG46182.1 hypothetical protein WS77_31005 [Burkholderia sp. MSMB0265]KVG89672.1 hypothetical protein WS81_21790 [Burkholderia sp. MSMB2040]KVG91709.1 hypothetical protein WS82_13940 [Burkholderia sp. MSMB2041]KVK90071.1 hypothetical protein WS91_27025 [Burkholderia sp. MSMB1498]